MQKNTKKHIVLFSRSTDTDLNRYYMENIKTLNEKLISSCRTFKSIRSLVKLDMTALIVNDMYVFRGI